MALPRLIFITGKGGTGKSTLAAALATALSHRYPTTLADLDRRQSAARILDAKLYTTAPARVSEQLEVTSLSPRAELEAFIQRIVPLKLISRRMLKSRTFGYVTAALPGLEAFLMLERLRELAGQAALNDAHVVIDAPATGTALELLSVARAVKGLAPFGTLNNLAGEVEDFLGDPNRFGVVLTLTPEELSLREAIEAAAALSDAGIATVAALLNAVPDALFGPEELAAVSRLGEHAKMAARRVEAAASATRVRKQLERGGLRVIELSMVFAPSLGSHQVRELSRKLEAEMLP